MGSDNYIKKFFNPGKFMVITVTNGVCSIILNFWIENQLNSIEPDIRAFNEIESAYNEEFPVNSPSSVEQVADNKGVGLFQYSAGCPIFILIYLASHFFNNTGPFYTAFGSASCALIAYKLQIYFGNKNHHPKIQEIIDYLAKLLPIIRYDHFIFPSTAKISFFRWSIVPLAWINEVLVFLPSHRFQIIQNYCFNFLPDRIVLIFILYIQILHYFIVDF